MISVTIRNNVNSDTIIVDANKTLRSVLEDKGVDYTRGMTTLDGSPLKAGDLDKTFADFGIVDKCWLCTIVKADNA